MTLRTFLDAAEAIWVAEYQRIGMNLLEALDETAAWSSAGPKEEESNVVEISQRRTVRDATANQNDSAFQALQLMLMGTDKA